MIIQTWCGSRVEVKLFSYKFWKLIEGHLRNIMNKLERTLKSIFYVIVIILIKILAQIKRASKRK